jgi:hypothetical protein
MPGGEWFDVLVPSHVQLHVNSPTCYDQKPEARARAAADARRAQLHHPLEQGAPTSQHAPEHASSSSLSPRSPPRRTPAFSPSRYPTESRWAGERRGSGSGHWTLHPTSIDDRHGADPTVQQSPRGAHLLVSCRSGVSGGIRTVSSGFREAKGGTREGTKSPVVVEERNTYPACIEERYTAANTRAECGGRGDRRGHGDDGRQRRQRRVEPSEDAESCEYQGQAGRGGEAQGQGREL